MTDFFNKAREYRELTGQEPDTLLYSRLIDEEYREFITAESFAERLKEAADLVVVLVGYWETLDIDLMKVTSEVYDNNFGRMYQPDGTIKRREDGKIEKNPDYPKPNMEKYFE